MSELLIANTARYPHDTIDGETLLIDTESGHLLMIGGVGPLLWQRLLGGVTLAEAEVVIPAATAAAEAAALDWPDAFVAPMLERYDDIANIMAVDPIHDVDRSAGWPRLSGDTK